ncbi:hypothetical protein FAM09_29730 [Niastella caeni]|uniref:Lipoprotein n=1 Tax=Niastella caeni TaxID=2569763 RepID=A0A4S8H7X1_9BACT|nr:hypothetical protein [Niastella caeni]THU30783.1 hypothetical protein FAM09_29730 [Niastella caeni]
MTTRNLLLVLFSLIIFNACSKDGDDEGNPGGTPGNTNEYKPGKKLLIDDLALYTSNGIIRDQPIIRDFMTRNFPEDISRFNIGQTTVGDHNISTNIIFLDNNKVKLNDIEMEIVSKNDKEMILSPLDSAAMPGSDPLGHCKLLHNQVPQYNPYSICQSAGGNCKKYRKAYPVIIEGGNYFLPLLKYALVSNCNIFTYTSKPLPNYFNKNIPNGMLKSKDSLLVQVSRLPLTK